MRFGRRGSDSIPEMVSVEGLSPTYRDSPRLQYPQELPANRGDYIPYTNRSPAWTKSQIATSQHNSSGYYLPYSEKKRRRICGLSPLIFAIAVIAILLIIVGAVVGGVLGSRSTQNKNVRSSSSNASQLPAGSGSSTISSTSIVASGGITMTTTVVSTVSVSSTASSSLTTSTTSATSTTSTISTTKSTSSTAVALIRPTSPARYVGIAAANVNNSNLKLFYIDKQKNGIIGFSHRGNGWENHGLLSGLNYAPSISNSIALSYWLDTNGEGVRLYYISQDSKIIELVLTCPINSKCTLSGQTVLPPTDVSDSSNVSVVQYWNSSRQFRAWVYYINKQNQVARTVYASGWSSATSTGFTAYSGSSVASTMVYADLLGHKTYYMRSDGSLSSIYEYEDGRTPSENVVANPTNQSAVSNAAFVAACDVPSSGSSYHEGRVFRMRTNSYPYEEFSRNGSTWALETSSMWTKADYGYQDGLAATSWYNSTLQQDHVKLYYPTNGTVQEWGVDTGTGWYNGYTFPSS